MGGALRHPPIVFRVPTPTPRLHAIKKLTVNFDYEKIKKADRIAVPPALLVTNSRFATNSIDSVSDKV